jgi:hypothetical protein
LVFLSSNHNFPNSYSKEEQREINFFQRMGCSSGGIQLSATEAGPYAGYLIIVDTDFTGSPEACKIDGNVNNTFTGTIFAPYCNVTINGASGDTSYNAQIIADEVKLNGNNTINFTYDPDLNRWNVPKVGLMR